MMMMLMIMGLFLQMEKTVVVCTLFIVLFPKHRGNQYFPVPVCNGLKLQEKKVKYALLGCFTYRKSEMYCCTCGSTFI